MIKHNYDIKNNNNIKNKNSVENNYNNENNNNNKNDNYVNTIIMIIKTMLILNKFIVFGIIFDSNGYDFRPGPILERRPFRSNF